MRVPTVIFIPSILSPEAEEMIMFVHRVYGDKCNPIMLSVCSQLSPKGAREVLESHLPYSRFIFCSLSVLSEMTTSERNRYLDNLEDKALVGEWRENSKVKFRGLMDNKPSALCSLLVKYSTNGKETEEDAPKAYFKTRTPTTDEEVEVIAPTVAIRILPRFYEKMNGI